LVTTASLASLLKEARQCIHPHLDRARGGRAALWIHVPDDADAKRAVRFLADHPVIHLRHYGQDRQEDLHLRMTNRAHRRP
jgi:hypothetical protein